MNQLHRISKSRLHSAALTKLVDLWNEKRQGRAFPTRADIDPVDLHQRKILGRVVLFDVLEAPRRFRFRLVGTEWVERFSIDPTGTFVDDYPREESRDFINGILGQTVDWREPAVISRTVVVIERTCNYEAALLPLSANGETIDMILVGFELRF